MQLFVRLHILLSNYTSYFNNGGANDVYLNASCVMYMNGSTDYAEIYFSNNSDFIACFSIFVFPFFSS